MAVLGTVEQRANDAVMRLNDFVDNRGLGFKRHGNQRGIAVRRFKFCQIGPRHHLTTLPCHLEKTVLMHLPFNAVRQVERTQSGKPFEMLQHVLRVQKPKKHLYYAPPLARPGAGGNVVIELRHIDPARNMRRFYRLDMQPDLFGGVFLMKQWGRIGVHGRVTAERFDNDHSAAVAMQRQAERKRRRG
jgi:predicted DNA-binding WGR domain protein